MEGIIQNVHNISNHYNVYFKYLMISFVNDTAIKMKIFWKVKYPSKMTLWGHSSKLGQVFLFQTSCKNATVERRMLTGSRILHNCSKKSLGEKKIVLSVLEQEEMTIWICKRASIMKVDILGKNCDFFLSFSHCLLKMVP